MRSCAKPSLVTAPKLVALYSVLAIGACYRELPRPESPTTDTATATETDTVVRRVMRVTRRPWMIQRATGIVRARRAFEPLDSVFALRVLDQRGAEMSGVPVNWTQVNAASGARMEVINAITDSLGISRATFTPGLTASAQGVRADVADVAGLDFLVRVAVGAIRVMPERAEIWSGETATLSVELRDSSGQVMPGGVVKWSTRDTSTVAVTSADSLHGAAVGRLAGIAAVTASIDSAKDAATVLVKPVLDARFITLAGTQVPSIRLDVQSGEMRETFASNDGRFSARVAVPLYGDTELRALPGDSSYHSAYVKVVNGRDVQGLTLVLIPRAWGIEAGSYAGQTIAIDAADALRRTQRGAGFWRVVPLRGEGVRHIPGWRHGAFPLRIAFDRRRSTEAISAADSVAFWTIAEQMQRDLGARLFVPADLPAEWRGGEVIPVEIRPGSEAGQTFMTWSEKGDAQDAVVSFRQAATLRDPHVVTHELLHLLGFGHAAGWRSVVAPSGSENRLTLQDVAYAQLAMRLRRLYQEYGVHPGLPAQPER